MFYSHHAAACMLGERSHLSVRIVPDTTQSIYRDELAIRVNGNLLICANDTGPGSSLLCKV